MVDAVLEQSAGSSAASGTCQRGWLSTAAGRVPVRRAGLRQYGTAGCGLGGLPVPPDRLRDDPGPPPPRPGPLRELFSTCLRGPSPAVSAWKGWLVCFDGTIMAVGPTARRNWPSTLSSAAARTAVAATRRCGCCLVSSVPGPSSTPVPSRLGRETTAPSAAAKPGRGRSCSPDATSRRVPRRAGRRSQGRVP